MQKKTKKLMLWAVGIILMAGIITLVVVNSGGDGQTSSSQYSASALSAVEKKFDFNTISMGNGKVSHQFEVKNDGAEKVVIEKVYTSCMCTAAYIISSDGSKYGEFSMPGHSGPSGTNIEVGPGESATVEAIFDPAAHGPSGVGLAQRSIYIETNSASSPKLEFSFQALVTR
ncbi:MAG: hypothetical protein A2932_01775 [Candidatus Spechtbacteria bacterium RIFCSPLOWO2_01_FULL_46_10]|uniref:DUF1573 domain-containing protein n=1 Tax=Candidatus Spechtbacteria bacterium RIFCSPLOWO2_01_FULL_46_10 TaxID=1802163 RepID=A0A1G2HDZ2_9BACT|nr:MAG: hypothetical protein A2932_01775 [Candidatus Spechtbacteria bacterium RIFCSPLOWO2_01_FULL_46_10]